MLCAWLHAYRDASRADDAGLLVEVTEARRDRFARVMDSMYHTQHITTAVFTDSSARYVKPAFRMKPPAYAMGVI